MGGGGILLTRGGPFDIIYLPYDIHFIMIRLFLLRLAARPGFVMIDDVSNDTEIRSKVSSGWQLLLC